MYYVYMKSFNTGREELIQRYDNAADAIHKIASNYNIDKNLCQLGEYYYFMVKR